MCHIPRMHAIKKKKTCLIPYLHARSIIHLHVVWSLYYFYFPPLCPCIVVEWDDVMNHLCYVVMNQNSPCSPHLCYVVKMLLTNLVVHVRVFMRR
jgi:hypothetical protein